MLQETTIKRNQIIIFVGRSRTMIVKMKKIRMKMVMRIVQREMKMRKMMKIKRIRMRKRMKMMKT